MGSGDQQAAGGRWTGLGLLAARVRLLAGLALLLAGSALQAQVQQVRVTPQTSQFRFRRSVSLTPAAGAAWPSACATLDADVYAHAEPSLSDVRLLGSSLVGLVETPYALTSSQTLPGSDRAQVLNAAVAGERLSFDLAMPPRAYTEVDLELGGSDFIAHAIVTGRRSLDGAERPVELGTFTFFDLSARQLARSTVLPLREASYAYLHVALSFSSADGGVFHPAVELVRGASVPPSREAQTLYTTIAETTRIVQRGTRTVAVFAVPAKVPVEQVEFVLAAGEQASFSRDVSLAASSSTAPAVERVGGQIVRVHLVSAGTPVDLDKLTLPATLGLNAKTPMTVEVAVENGAQAPIAFSAVRLKMRQRRICFDVPQGADAGLRVQAGPRVLTMFYGADEMEPAQYGFSRSFNPAQAVGEVKLGAEMRNASYKALPAVSRSFSRRHPEALWLAVLALVISLAMLAGRSARRA